MKEKYTPPKNDRLSDGFDDIVPKEYRGTDRFLDIVTWNIRYFHNRDKKRVERVMKILNALNADIIVLQEILDGSLEIVAEGLAKLGAGHYKTAYGKTGGDQRLAMMYDLDWVRAKSDITELFGKGTVVTNEGKEAFPRLPLLANFICLSQVSHPFDFQLMGVHLKSQRGDGSSQRVLAAKKLSEWLVTEAPKTDTDVIILGDWNEPPDADTWKPLRELEQQKKALFSALNDSGKISHLMYKTKSEFGSRLDLEAVSTAAFKQMKSKPDVVRWKSLDKLLATNPKGEEIKKFIQELSANVSDHMPVVTRFYWREKN